MKCTLETTSRPTFAVLAAGGEGEYSILPERGEAEIALTEAGLSEEKLGLRPGTGTGDAMDIKIRITSIVYSLLIS